MLLGMGASAGALEAPVGCTRAAPPGTSGSTRHHWAGFPLFREPASRLTLPSGSVEQARVQSKSILFCVKFYSLLGLPSLLGLDCQLLAPPMVGGGLGGREAVG